jgi:hypothetical protein
MLVRIIVTSRYCHCALPPAAAADPPWMKRFVALTSCRRRSASTTYCAVRSKAVDADLRRHDEEVTSVPLITNEIASSLRSAQ